MLENYLKIAFRNLKRNKAYTAINVSGLSVGITVFLIIFLIVKFELNFNTSFPHFDRIYRVISVNRTPNGLRYSAGVPFPVADGLRREFPMLNNVAAIFGTKGIITILNKEDDGPVKKFNEEEGIFYIEPQFFKIFDFKWLSGSPQSALSGPNSVVLTKDYAEKYFGNWKYAVGRSVKFNNSTILKVTGILDDLPDNNDFPLKVIISYSTFESSNRADFKDWVSVFGANHCFIELPGNMSEAGFNKKLVEFVKEHKPPEYAKDMLALQPLKEMHFDTMFGNYNNNFFSYGAIEALILIAVSLLIIACVNFINLSTAQAVNRSREVGIRKALGSRRSQLVFQFLSETAVITFLSIIIAFVSAKIFLPVFGRFLNVHINLSLLLEPGTISIAVLIFFTVTVLSGFYPALVMSGFNPVTVFKSKSPAYRSGGLSLRKTLVVFQFVVAQILIIGLLTAIYQMNYFQNFNLGIDKDAVVILPVPGNGRNMQEIGSLKNKLLSVPGVKYVSYSLYPPAYDAQWTSDFKYNGSLLSTNFNAQLLWTDADYFKLYKIKLIAGRFYGRSDSVKGFVVNETLVKKLGIRSPGDILGKRLNFWNGHLAAPVVGVIKDFNARPLNMPMSAVVMGSWKSFYRMINIKLEPGSVKTTMSSIKRLWSSAFPDYVYEYKFLDRKIDDIYIMGNRILLMLDIFTAIAILISCLGLYGLVSFLVASKTKEIGIRKVLGAKSAGLLFMFAKEFILLILIAFVISAPVAYIRMKGWLSNYAYHIRLGADIFLIAVSGTIFIAWITVGYTALKAATANPVKSLKYE